jgi:hypothetical protein
MTRKISALLVLMMILGSAISAGAGQKDEKDEVQLLIQSAKFLEEKPLDKKAKDVRQWAMQWLIVTDKVSVTVCSLLLSGSDKKYKYGSEILGQYTIGMAAFKLSNPDKAKDEEAAQLAGIESALRSYDAMVAEQPKAKNLFMDDLIAKRGDGTLAKYVAQNNCKEKGK